MNGTLEAGLREMHERVCKAISDPKRLLIISVLREDELRVGDIAESLGMSQPNASQHLAVLRDGGIVTTRRSGTSVYYSLRGQKILRAIDLMREFVAEDLSSRAGAQGAGAQGAGAQGAGVAGAVRG